MKPSTHHLDLQLLGNRWDEYRLYDNEDNLGTNARFIDTSYVTSVVNAAPNLEELELIGETSKEQHIVRLGHTLRQSITEPIYRTSCFTRCRASKSFVTLDLAGR
jgi:hypothetical protein